MPRMKTTKGASTTAHGERQSQPHGSAATGGAGAGSATTGELATTSIGAGSSHSGQPGPRTSRSYRSASGTMARPRVLALGLGSYPSASGPSPGFSARTGV